MFKGIFKGLFDYIWKKLLNEKFHGFIISANEIKKTFGNNGKKVLALNKLKYFLILPSD